jgi:hypothetical protein
MVQWSAKESLARGAASSGGGGGAVQVLRLDPPASPGTSPGGGGPRELAISGVDFTPSVRREVECSRHDAQHWLL